MIRSTIKYKEIEAIKEAATSENHENERRRGKKGGSSSFLMIKKVAALVKDKQSLFCIKLSGKKDYRNQALETAIVMATSHDETEVDYRNANRVFEWIKTSPTFLRPFFWYLTKRIEKTRSWVVALKALMLVHGVFCTKLSALRNLPRLPFDLSNFHDRYSDPARAWGFSLLVRSYYAFLDHKSSFTAHDDDDDDEMRQGGCGRISIARLQRLQTLLDLLLQIKPYSDGMEVALVLDAMDCVLIEIFEVYSGICDGVAAMLCSLFSLNKGEAAMALRILETVTAQNAMLADYFDDCRRMGVLNAMELPGVEQQIPEEDISDIKGIIKQILRNGGSGGFVGIDQDPAGPSGRQLDDDDGDKRDFFKGSSQTIVRQDWVVFNDEMEVEGGGGGGGEQGNGCNGGGKKDLFYDFGSSLYVGNGRRRDFNALRLRPAKMERGLI
ncbi:hypothetical protein ACLOJK_025558 [Asimina triloba]